MMAKIQILSGDKNSWYSDYVGLVVEVDEYFSGDKFDGEPYYSLTVTKWNRDNLTGADFKCLQKYGLIVKKSDADLIAGTVSSSEKTGKHKASPVNHFVVSAPNVKCDLVLPFDVEEEESLKSVNIMLDKLENQGSIESINKLIEARKYVDTLRSLNIGSEADFEDMESEIKNNIKKYLEKIGIKGLDIL